MRKTRFEEIGRAASDLASSANVLLERFNQSTGSGTVSFNVSKLIHGSDVSYADCVSRITSVAEIAGKFEGAKDLLLVPLSHVTQLKQAIDDTQQRLDTLANQFQQIFQSGGGIAAFNYDNFHLQASNGQNHDLRSHFKQVSDATEILLEAFFRILVILRPAKTTYSFQAATKALSGVIEAASGELEKLRADNVALKKAVANAESKASDAKTAAEEAVRNRDEAAKDRKTVGEYLSDATDKKATIDTVHAATEALEAKVEEYEKTFTAFQRQLDDRNTDFETGQKQQQHLFKQFDKQRDDVAALIRQSEDMLKGATVAGLASSFSTAKSSLDWQLFFARLSFYFGILFLFASAIPLMVYVFFPILAPLLKSHFPEFASVGTTLDAQHEVTGWQYLGQVLARFIILLPAAWFVSFSAIRHSSLFRLREHYAYKYSMAVAVEGFRKQAPGYESEIAALVLEQIAFNPADKLIHSKDLAEGKVPHPLMNLILERFRSGLSKGGGDPAK